MSQKIFLILHNIRSLHNVGSIFRTAECAGVSKIYLTGYTPAPKDIFGKYRKELSKVALGAEKIVPWEKQRDVVELIKNLKKAPKHPDKSGATGQAKISAKGGYALGGKIIALEQGKKSTDYRKFKPRFPLALILGNEVRGLSKQILKKCDAIIEIPLYGKKESLNVAVAAGVILFALRKNNPLARMRRKN